MAGLTPPRPLTAADQRAGFDCGRESLNQWFHRHAWRNQQAGVSRTSILCDPVDGRIVGYVSLSAAQIERAFLPKSAQRNRPDQGQGVARSLMLFALTTAVRLSKDVGCFCVLTHPLDDTVRAFYRNFGFEDLPFDPARSMAVRIVDLIHNGLGTP